MLKAVIFDLDGVIVDSHEAHRIAWKTLLNSVGREVDERELDFVVEGRKRQEILRYFLGNLSEEQQQEYGEHKDRIFREHAKEIKTIPGVMGFFDQLSGAGITLAVATSAARQRAEEMLERLDLRSRFRTVVAGDDVTNGKPDPTIFCLAAEGLGVAADSIVVCEDAVAGVQAAKRAGMRCVAVATNGRASQLRQAGADMVTEDFVEMRLEHLQALFSTTNAVIDQT
jgi:beta-phosphoglucomutase